MSKLSRLRKKWFYESQAPRCINCAHFRKPGIFLRNSLPVKSPPICSAGDFITGPNAICDNYKDDMKGTKNERMD
jgi:hypothetical protein